MNHLNLEEFERKIAYTFSDKNLLILALTHSSYANETKKGSHENNERLEFLGDAVLDMVVSEYMYRHFPKIPEGELTKLRAAVVCEKALHSYSLQLHVGDYLRLGKGELHTGGNERPSILADAFEAIVAAVYLDGGLEPAKKLVLRFVVPEVSNQRRRHFKDYKTTLQEIIQQNPGEMLEYVLTGESGPDHNKQFTVQVFLNSNIIGTGRGRSKKDAEQQAAKEALALMGYR